MIDQGKIITVQVERLGSVLASDHALGATTLFVDATDPDFPETGTLMVGTDIIDYTAVDDTLNSITLATGILADYDADTPVYVYPIAERTWAHVLVGDDDDDAVIAEVPHALLPVLSRGVKDPDEYQSAVIEDRGGSWIVKDIVGSPTSFTLYDSEGREYASITQDSAVFRSVTIRPLTIDQPALLIQDDLSVTGHLIEVRDVADQLGMYLTNNGFMGVGGVGVFADATMSDYPVVQLFGGVLGGVGWADNTASDIDVMLTRADQYVLELSAPAGFSHPNGEAGLNWGGGSGVGRSVLKPNDVIQLAKKAGTPTGTPDTDSAWIYLRGDGLGHDAIYVKFANGTDKKVADDT